MNFITQYVVVEDKEMRVRESFLGFITEHGVIAYDIKMILDRLEKEKLDFEKYKNLQVLFQRCEKQLKLLLSVFLRFLFFRCCSMFVSRVNILEQPEIDLR